MANTQNLDLVKPLGTDYALVSVLNSNSDKIDAYAGAVNASLDGLRDGLGILADGNTHAAITSGQFVYVKNHQTLPQGLYQATTNIAANGTLSTSNLTADPKGGLNTLNEQIGTLASKNRILSTSVSNNGSGSIGYGAMLVIIPYTQAECVCYFCSNNNVKVMFGDATSAVTVTSSSNIVTVSNHVGWQIAVLVIGLTTEPYRVD